MSLFDVLKRKKYQEKQSSEKRQKAKEEASAKASDFISGKPKKEKEDKKDSKILVSPHVTEKSAGLESKRAYVFKVSPKANKVMIKGEVKRLYGVRPAEVNIVNIPDKEVFVRRKHGVKSGYKKAIVYLKEGDKLNIA